MLRSVFGKKEAGHEARPDRCLGGNAPKGTDARASWGLIFRNCEILKVFECRDCTPMDVSGVLEHKLLIK